MVVETAATQETVSPDMQPVQTQIRPNERKKANKYCLLDTPRKVMVDINSSSVQNIKKFPKQ